MLSDYYPPHVGGGVERVVSELCGGLVRKGHTVRVLTLATRPAPAEQVDGAASVVRVPATDLTTAVGFQFAVSVRLPFALRRQAREFRPDVVHAHNFFFRTTEAAALPGLGLGGVPLVTTLHLGRPEGGSPFLRFLMRGYEATAGRVIVRRTSHVTAVSEAVAAHARRMTGGRVPVTTVPNGVDLDRFRPASPAEPVTRKVVLFVGRFVPNKGPDVLLRSAPAVLAQHPETSFLFVGDGPMHSRLERLARSLSVSHAVHFPGLRNDVDDLMRDASVFARPSHLEGLPLTVLEAMASGLPVVATPVGGTPELVRDGETGYLVPPDDPEALAGAICSLLDDPQHARRMGRRGRATVEAGYGWDSVTERTEDVYREVLAR